MTIHASECEVSAARMEGARDRMPVSGAEVGVEIVAVDVASVPPDLQVKVDALLGVGLLGLVALQRAPRQIVRDAHHAVPVAISLS